MVLRWRILHSFHAVSPDTNRRISFWWQNFGRGFFGSWHQSCERSGTGHFRHSYLWENLVYCTAYVLENHFISSRHACCYWSCNCKISKSQLNHQVTFLYKASRHQCCLKQSPTSQERWQDTQDGWLMSSLKMVTWCQMACLKMINHDQLMMSPKVVPIVSHLISIICKHTACGALLSMVWVVWCCFCVCSPRSFSPARTSWLLRRQTYRTPDEVLFGLAYTTSDCTDGGWGVVPTVCFWYGFYNCSE